MSNKQRLYVDLHVIQTVPPSCVNRDDTGSPKTAKYGGVTRARVSSQSWKRAIRLAFADLFEENQIGTRTKKSVGMVSEEIQKINPIMTAEQAEKIAGEALKTAGLTINKNQEMDALFFISKAQAAALAQLAVDGEKDKKAYRNAIAQNPSYDMALFGRMVASDPSLNYDAACQVAHSISTHAVTNEFDYFTAVDDRQVEDNAGAGHIGVVEFNSSTLYRYATVNVLELQKNLGMDTAAVVKGFAEAFICSMPTGKQNSFANRTLPSMVYVTIRNDQPINLVDAFEKPVVSNNGYDGYKEASQNRLIARAKQVYQQYGASPVRAFGFGADLESMAENTSLPQLLTQLEQSVEQLLAAHEEA
jgi:CRISPR system Cascade subunit CasC